MMGGLSIWNPLPNLSGLGAWVGRSGQIWAAQVRCAIVLSGPLALSPALAHLVQSKASPSLSGAKHSALVFGGSSHFCCLCGPCSPLPLFFPEPLCFGASWFPTSPWLMGKEAVWHGGKSEFRARFFSFLLLFSSSGHLRNCLGPVCL